jgi:hypothetical protein
MSDELHGHGFGAYCAENGRCYCDYDFEELVPPR